MITAREKIKKKPPKDSLTLLPCFYFVEVRATVYYQFNTSIEQLMSVVITLHTPNKSAFLFSFEDIIENT